MIYNLTNFAEESSGLSALGVDGKAFIFQLITFVLAFFVLKRFAFSPILKVLDERRKTIESGVSLGEEMQKERADLDAKIQAELVDARKQADGIVAQASDAARDTVRSAEDKAREKAENIIKEAHNATEQDAARVRKQIEKEVVSLISDATEAIIDEKLDATKDAALIDRALKGQKA